MYPYNMTLLNIAIASMLAIALIESLVISFVQKKTTHFNEALSTSFIVILKPLFKLGFITLLAGSYFELIAKHDLVTLSWLWRVNTFTNTSLFYYITLLILIDFLYYWEHRLKHQVRWFWANHIVHHSSENYNLFAALRLGWTGSITTNVLFLTPLPIMGYYFEDVLLLVLLHNIYQFATHIDWCPKLGILEKILVTPSHHRVHHASNESYLNKNYGGMFIVFDKIFGTFKEEQEKCKYGLTTPAPTQRPTYIIVMGWVDLYNQVKQKSKLVSKLKYLFVPTKL